MRGKLDELDLRCAIMALVELLGVRMPVEAAIVLVGEAVVGVVLVIAFYLAATHKGRYHHWMMLSAFLFDELVLKGIMVRKLLDGALGSYPYEGTGGTPHVVLSAICTVAGIAVIYLGFRHRVRRAGNMFLPPKGRKPHKIVGLVYLASWAATLLVGMRIFWDFYV